VSTPTDDPGTGGRDVDVVVVGGPGHDAPAETAAVTESGLMSAGRRLGFAVTALIMGLIALVAFGLGSESGLDSRLVLNKRGESTLPDIVLPARVTALVIGAFIVGLGLAQLGGLLRRRTYLWFGIVLTLFVVALIAWAARDDSISILGLFQGTLFKAVPVALGALAGLLCERSGVINIGIEGMLLAAAFTAALTASAADSVWVGLASGIAIGALMALLLAVLSIRYKVDQIIGGTVINILALGLTSYLGTRVLSKYQDLNQPGSFGRTGLPLLKDIPFFGPLLFDNTIYVYIMFVLVFGLTYALYRTRWGLRVRAVGEHPGAADTVGINVIATRYRSVILGGALAGLAGTWFTLDAVSGFNENMTAGRGFIALAALIFGRWHPIGAFIAALVFGFTEELQGRLALLHTSIPSELLLAAPYVITIIVVAGLVGRARPPAADGQVYER
jgi:simple sugar transport system permease protein